VTGRGSDEEETVHDAMLVLEAQDIESYDSSIAVFKGILLQIIVQEEDRFGPRLGTLGAVMN
jgi:hypothetical protein